MNTELSKDDRDALIRYRIERSYETLEEAAYNAAGSYYNTAVNRLYYAAYYAASALMLANNLSATTHAGIKTQLSQNFVKTGRLPHEHGKTFLTLFENRQSGDYEDFVYCDLNLYNQLLPKTQAFISAIKALITESDNMTKSEE